MMRSSLMVLGLSALAWGQPGPVQPATVEGSLHSIQLPNFNPDLPPAPQRDLFLNRCTVCHSARYVLMQFPMTRTVWTAEVAKMRKAYGCAVPEADREKVVDYLMEIRGSRP